MTTNDTHDHVPLPAQRIEPYAASFEGFAAARDEWGNTVSVTTVARHDPTLARRVSTHHDEADWAADYYDRQLVHIDTNYKASRPGAAPVDLTRPDAARFAAAVLTAIEDTFHCRRVGELRAIEAAELLAVLSDVEQALSELREHALGDLLRRMGLEA